MTNDDGRTPGRQLSDSDKRILKDFDQLSVEVGLRLWIEKDSECQALLERSLLALPDQIPIAESEIRRLVFTGSSRVGRSTILSTDFNVFETGRDGRVNFCGGREHSVADRTIQERIIAFFDLLRNGIVNAASLDGPVPPNVWKRTDGILIVENSDLVVGEQWLYGLVIVYHATRKYARNAQQMVGEFMDELKHNGTDLEDLTGPRFSELFIEKHGQIPDHIGANTISDYFLRQRRQDRSRKIQD